MIVNRRKGPGRITPPMVESPAAGGIPWLALAPRAGFPVPGRGQRRSSAAALHGDG
jgi:hypothetical protein